MRGHPAFFARPLGRPTNQALQASVDKFLKLQIGQSIFMKDTHRREVDYFRRQVIKAGAGIRVETTDCDAEHAAPGLRIYRLSGPIDQERTR